MLNPPDTYWIAIGDLHDKVEGLASIPGLAEAAGVIVTGDITNTGGVPQARKVLEEIARYNPHILAQIGNMDRPEISDWLDDMDANLHTKVRLLAPDVVIMGIGGSTFTPFGTPSEFPEARFADWLESMWHDARHYRQVVLVSHNPPRDTLCDLTGETTHVGSMALREFLVECQPDICLCGHIHESRAVDRLGKTTVVNPGSLGSGGYAVLQLQGNKLTATRHMLGETPPA